MFSLVKATAAALGLLLPSISLAAPQGFSLMPDMLEPHTSDHLVSVSMEVYSPPSSYTGDVLNVTRCFCEDPKNIVPSEQESDDMHLQTSTWGHHYQFDYYNWHLKTLYPLSLTCSSSEQVYDHRRMLPLCWEEKSESKDCGVFPDGNMFCYQVGTLGKWSDHQNDHYMFNRQKRGLPQRHGVMEPDMCDGFCREKLGMVVARDAESKYVKTWKKGGGAALERKIESKFTTYVDTDDMCAGCR